MIPTPPPIPDPDWLPDWFDVVNWFAWVASNVLVGYVVVALVIFLIGYFLFFDPRATTGGRLIFRFVTSIFTIMVLVFIGVFIDPHAQQQWFDYPGDVVWWRPIVRLIGYAFAAYTITSLAILLVKRKWFSHKIDTAPADENTLVQLRQRDRKQKIKNIAKFK